MTYLLEYSAPPDLFGFTEKFYFVKFGSPWPHKPDFNLVAQTTPDPIFAHHFKSHAEAERFQHFTGPNNRWQIIPFNQAVTIIPKS